MPDTKFLQTGGSSPVEPPAPPPISKDDQVDLDLMKNAATGDMTSYALLFKRHSDRIWRLSYLMLHSAVMADDVVQDTFTRALTHIGSFRGESGPKAWLSSIALNLCRHIIRDRKKEAEFAGTDKLEHGVRLQRPRTRGVMTSAIRREENRMLTLALGFLTDAQREVFVLHYVDGLPYDDVGSILGIRAGAARALAHRAKGLLTKRLGADAEGFLSR